MVEQLKFMWRALRGILAKLEARIESMAESVSLVDAIRSGKRKIPHEHVDGIFPNVVTNEPEVMRDFGFTRSNTYYEDYPLGLVEGKTYLLRYHASSETAAEEEVVAQYDNRVGEVGCIGYNGGFVVGNTNLYINQSWVNATYGAVNAILDPSARAQKQTIPLTAVKHEASEGDMLLSNGVKWRTQNAKELIEKNSTRIPIVTTTGSGTYYSAWIEGVTELVPGMLIIIIPHKVSSGIYVYLNVSGLGSKPLRTYSATTEPYKNLSMDNGHFLKKGKPVLLMYDGSYWLTVTHSQVEKTAGIQPVTQGGTGLTSIPKGNYLVGAAGVTAITTLTPAEVLENIGAQPAVIASSTAGSTKKFKITVDDSGTITATEVT